jgi:hypothetical protein
MPLPTPGTNDTFMAALRTRALGQNALVTISSSQAVSLDAGVGGPMYVYALNSVGAISSWTISNAVDGQIITIMLHRAGSQSVTWPTNFRWAGNVAPTLGAGPSWNFIEMQYVASVNLWLERSRSLGVPGT